jgi:predicted ATPase/DNA-binding SARP family transcriptional activator
VETLTEVLWPARAPADPHHALQTLVTRLRQALPGGSAVRWDGRGYQLGVPAWAVDALAFEDYAAAGRKALADGNWAEAEQALTRGLELWRGEPLADVAHLPFAAAPIAQLTELRLCATEDLQTARLNRPGAARVPVAELRALIAADPLRERPRGLLMTALRQEGRTVEALAAYEEYRQLTVAELGADPGPELQALHRELLRPPPPGGRPWGRVHGNLKAPLNSFVGRQAELSALRHALDGHRLVSLVGPGGVGKTRLACAAAEQLADRFAGGVWMVELASVSPPQALPGAVAKILGLREEGLAEALAVTRALIVLDNCEHLVAETARLAVEILGRCPGITVLATSREPLGVPGEALFPVEPLAPPATPDDDAALLFTQRAATVRPGFAVTGENLATVTSVCRRLDGLPLAIELAAARMRTLPLSELAARLDDRLVLLSGTRTGPPRHRTLRAVVDWSWELLDDREQRVARRAAVFPSAFTLAAAEAVCGPEDDVLCVLSDLVNKSMLELVDGPGPAYRMLETIREYGLEQLTAAEEADRARDALCRYFLEMAERTEPMLRTADQLPAIRALSADRENLRAALDHALTRADTDVALRLTNALILWWLLAGDHDEAMTRVSQALRSCVHAPESQRAQAVGGYLLCAVWAGRRIEDSVSADFTASRHPFAVLAPALVALLADDLPAGRAAVRSALAGQQAPWSRGMLWLARAMLDGNGGDARGLRRALWLAVEEFRTAGERSGLSFALLALADTLPCAPSAAEPGLGTQDDAMTDSDPGAPVDAGGPDAEQGSGPADADDPHDVTALLEESVTLLSDLEEAFGQSGRSLLQRVWLAAARARAGHTEQARTELLELVADQAAGPSSRHQVFARLVLGDLARRDGDTATAGEHYAAATTGASSLLPQLAALLATGLAQVAVASGRLAEAERRVREGWRRLDAAPPDMSIAAGVAVAVAAVRLARRAPRDAAEVLGAAYALGGPSAVTAPDADRVADRLRDELGPAVYAELFARGRIRSRQDALAFIRSRIPESG